MKTLLFILIPFFATSQIQVSKTENFNSLGKATYAGTLVAEISYSFDNNDTLYNFKFKNQQYSKITDYKNIQFYGRNNTLNDFYAVLMSFFSDENRKNKDYKVNFKLGEEDVTASNFRQLGSTYVWLQSKNGMVILTKKNINEMFGKD